MLVFTSLLSVQQAEAQTCVTPPSCEALGFNKNSADCVGKTMLKCPFDITRIYCPSEQENWKTYKLGDLYIKDKIVLGKVVDVNSDGTHGLIITINAYTGNLFEASAGCMGMKDGGLAWSLPDRQQIKLETLGTAINSYYVWGAGGVCVQLGKYSGVVNLTCFKNEAYCNSSFDMCPKELVENFRLAYYCVANF